MTLTRFARYAWIVLAYNIFVVLYGAFVRATGSGAGCGAHWPLCNGVVIPRPERIETLIEFGHRVTSGLTLILVLVLLVWAWRSFPRGSLVRKGAAAVVFFTITEALVGAGLVLFGWVADNDSIARAISMMVHLVNTFLLIGSITVTAWWATTGEPGRLTMKGAWGWLLIAGGLAMLVLGASGAVTALGDTLFPSGSLSQGFEQDFSPTAHYLIRMRIYHPGIAVGVGLYLFALTYFVRRKWLGENAPKRLETITTALFGLYAAQIILGITNVALLAPVWMQILHLLVSNLVWITFLLMSAVLFGSPRLAARVGEQNVHHRMNEAAN